MNLTEIQDLQNLKRTMEAFRDAYSELIEAWINSNTMLLERKYPFTRSFDELGIQEWVADSCARLDAEIADLKNTK